VTTLRNKPLSNAERQRQYRERHKQTLPTTYTDAMRQEMPPKEWSKLMGDAARTGHVPALMYIRNISEGMPRQSVDTTLLERREYVLKLVVDGSTTALPPPNATQPMLDTTDGG
jgi:hypothetical protein